MSRRFLHVLCVFLLLVAQQGAITHGAWHALGNSARTADVRSDPQLFDAEQSYPVSTQEQKSNPPAGQSQLCAFDIAFGQMLGGAHGGAIAFAHVPLAVERVHDLTTPRLHAEALSPKSRGPPALL